VTERMRDLGGIHLCAQLPHWLEIDARQVLIRNEAQICNSEGD